jgi:hypothetical protein
MAMKATVSKGDRAGSDDGGEECSSCYGSGRARGTRRRQHTHEPVAATSWPSGQRRKTKGWGPLVSEGEGRAGLGRAGREAKAHGEWGESGPAEGEGLGDWAKNLSWVQFKK